MRSNVRRIQNFKNLTSGDRTCLPIRPQDGLSKGRLPFPYFYLAEAPGMLFYFCRQC